MKSQTITVRLQAGIEQVQAIGGNVFRVMEAASPVKIGTDDTTPNAEHNQGTGERVLGGFEKMRFLSDVTQEVTILVGSGDLYDSRLSLSAPVSVIDGGHLDTVNGLAFMGGYQLAASPGLYSLSQLYNPPGSGIDVILKQFSISSSAAAYAFGYYSSPQLGLVSARGVSKQADISGGVDSAAHIRVKAGGDPYEGALNPSGFGPVSTYVSAQPIIVPMREPIILPPGVGLTISLLVVNITLGVQYEWLEVPQ